MAMVGYIIHSANDSDIEIDAIKGLNEAKRRAAISGGIFVASKDDLCRMNCKAVLQLHNAVAHKFDQPTVHSFDSRADGAEQTFRLLNATYGKQAETPKIRHSRKGKGIDLNTGEPALSVKKGTNLAPKDWIKPPGKGTKSANVLALILRPEGARYNELYKVVGGKREDVWHTLHLLNRKCGYGIRTIGRSRNPLYKGYHKKGA